MKKLINFLKDLWHSFIYFDFLPEPNKYSLWAIEQDYFINETHLNDYIVGNDGSVYEIFIKNGRKIVKRKTSKFKI